MINGKKCVLIADDEEKMVRALSDLFRAKGFEVIKAYDGKQALDEYCKNNTKVDIVLLDVMMPEIDGFEVADEIRRSASLVPIILITARGEEYDQLKGFSVGVNDYVSKPFSPSVLLAQTVNNYVQNAISHTADDKPITISLTKDESCAKLSVENFGKKIEERDMEHLWDAFYKSDKAKTRNGKNNVGLGLYIVRTIIEKHGGTYGVHNTEKGVAFWWKIPLCD